MDPRAHERATECALALRALALVVWEHVVHASGVDVQALPQVLRGHGGTLDVPAGEAVAPRAGPEQHSARLGRLPQREVARVTLQRVGLRPHALQQVSLRVAGQSAVVGEAGHGEIHVALHLVGVAPLHEPLRDPDHFVDVVRGAREVGGGQYAQLGLIPVECLGVEVRYLPRSLALRKGGGDHLVFAALQHFLAHVADIGYILYVDYAQPLDLQAPADPVGHEVRPQVANVCVAVDRGAAAVHPHQPRLKGLHRLHTPGEGIGKSHSLTCNGSSDSV